ncbi:hypothetical protein [Candidatus Amarolinea dominans]|uniref:hypothetical protein n=1 Tax=Candidatus Amarolinea dominans TaxID=3140696 RepID=UPI001D739116|nr:hypothetical protein [Anaerolineae bacterium]
MTLRTTDRRLLTGMIRPTTPARLILMLMLTLMPTAGTISRISQPERPVALAC